MNNIDDKWSLEKAQELALSKFKRDDKTGLYKKIWDSVLKVLEVGVYTGHKFGTKWQQEQDKNRYSEEDIENIWNEFVKESPPINNGSSSDFLEYIKQFKKN
jgi:hypothetical protein